eukprot:jgi/Mesvir1/18306/Mv25749-RA.1
MRVPRHALGAGKQREQLPTREGGRRAGLGERGNRRGRLGAPDDAGVRGPGVPHLFVRDVHPRAPPDHHGEPAGLRALGARAQGEDRRREEHGR